MQINWHSTIQKKAISKDAVSMNLQNRTNHARCLGSVHTTSEKFEKRSFISPVRPTVHANPSRKRCFSKTLFKPEEFENAGFSFSCGQKTFWKRSFSKMIASRIFLNEFSSNTNPKRPVIVTFFSSSGVVWTEKFDAFSEWNLRFQIPPA